MDRDEFDSLARGVGKATTRRATLATLGATLLGLGVGSAVDAGKKRRRRNRPRGGDANDKLCCEYTCERTSPDVDPEVKRVCIPNAKKGQTRCEGSYQGCSFSNATFTDSCKKCSGSVGQAANLCCTYICETEPQSFKNTCKPGITPGKDRCDSSFEGCSFHTADFVTGCDACPAA